MFKTIALGILVVVLVFLGYVAMQPADYKVERSIDINAPADVVFSHIADFNRWSAWNPWQKMEPSQSVTVAGEPGQAGHSHAWKGEKTGAGKMTIQQIRVNRQVDILLEFTEPMQSQASTALVVTPAGEGVTVTWAMAGENDFMGKFFDVLMDVEAMVGESYEQGLSDLKTIAEREASAN